MTLLITLAKSSVIHQCSDYRISSSGQIIATANGTKQMSVLGINWTGIIAITGLASCSGYNTRQWICEQAKAESDCNDPADFVDKLRLRGTQALERALFHDKRLSILIASAKRDGGCRLFLVSNFEKPGQKEVRKSDPVLASFELNLYKPRILIHGQRDALSRPEQQALERLFGSEPNLDKLVARVAEANKRAALLPKYRTSISEGCWVTSIFAGGRTVSRNFGKVAGIPSQITSGADIRDYSSPIHGLLPRQHSRMIVSATALGSSTPPIDTTGASLLTVVTRPDRHRLLPQGPVGPPREVEISTSTNSVAGWPSKQHKCPRVELGGRSAVVTLYKNRWVQTVLSDVMLDVEGLPQNAVSSPVWLENDLILAGFKIRNWRYALNFQSDGEEAVLSIHMNSVSLRVECAHGEESPLTASEEILLAAPCFEQVPDTVTDNYGNVAVDSEVTNMGRGSIFIATRGLPVAKGKIVAMLLLRDIPCAQ